MTRMRMRAAMGFAAVIGASTVAGSALVAHDAGRQFADMNYAPPMRPHVVDEAGRVHRPFVYPLRLVNRLEHRFAEDRSIRMPLVLFESGALVSVHESPGVWLPLGGDALGRDILARIAS